MPSSSASLLALLLVAATVHARIVEVHICPDGQIIDLPTYYPESNRNSIYPGDDGDDAANQIDSDARTDQQEDIVRCANLTGVWYNHHGSEMIICHGADGSLLGEYRTGVESGNGTAGTSHSAIYGATAAVADGVGAFGFTVVYRNGKSAASWSGQCLHCSGCTGSSALANNDPLAREYLFTTWLLTSMTTPENLWSATRIGHDTFARASSRNKPMRSLGQHTPPRRNEA
ncbi:PREDICTED: streptavidin-V2-like [Priapulus caudatus]|uniref:Streptavidin-V2-like n=1 Tax=Priapulus caudatus TaxID=37621 RepID=A0ABM1E8A3_PRICU|nr:PREDICTED: streptavidin-V2-like [Priapulus caudatus]